MSKLNFYKVLEAELKRVDEAKVAKRQEKVIEKFNDDFFPKAVINGREYAIFNSNDYLGLRFFEELRSGEAEAAGKYGTGPGAVRFISGTMKVYKDLEKKVAGFHYREEAMVFSSAFAANLAVIACLSKGQSKDSLLSGQTLIVSDELNHRSIIDGVRVAGLAKEQKLIYKHLDYASLEQVLEENLGKFKRVLVVTDGIFSMLGEYADVGRLEKICRQFNGRFEEGVFLIVDDSHGVGACGESGRGCEELTGGKADILVGTFGKAFGSDGGYAVGNKILIDYLREAAATYIYSNSISPGVAGAALAAVRLVDSAKGKKLLRQLEENISLFKKLMKKYGFTMAADSVHPIQPVLIADPFKTKALTDKLFAKGYLVTNINYPVVPKGKDEIRVQISAAQSREDIEKFAREAAAARES
ncbi:MAG: 7-keto-8-aminopelargonate synthetase and related enzyme, glycine C-acetyltransferase [Candidatus Gottesmanbacteria bacterium GW2011_GWA2_43_14]|uniref:7-keto-8-aminopelargonate synthetase and related enzyme, glycine C-acetyltransferase n=1 Tax=Candidatus Gottesmanbacteria bacterium GW2011_GWA2_43_14 TaxID=1618443 RepID=A0A0G1GAJ7_9BACT|nr:MAG: 7-keto-8-aminopelargonate synthetase and related enzyme, glycine C-acetyltransferase [Candidatus Gottesmanbacteria bacterium GW2011_GWA2_43_14]